MFEREGQLYVEGPGLRHALCFVGRLSSRKASERLGESEVRTRLQVWAMSIPSMLANGKQHGKPHLGMGQIKLPGDRRF